jgi:hypothetical protein
MPPRLPAFARTRALVPALIRALCLSLAALLAIGVISAPAPASAAERPGVAIRSPEGLVIGSPLIGDTNHWTEQPIRQRTWKRNGLLVSNNPGYVIQEADLRALMVYTEYDGQNWSTATVMIPPGVPVVHAATVSGQPVTGSVLHADIVVHPAGDLTYQWRRDGADLPGAVAPTYPVTNADAGALLSVVIRSERPGWYPVTVPAEAVARAQGVIELPSTSLVGEPEAGQSLAVETGPWAPGPDALSYAWYAGDDAIPGAVEPVLPLTDDLVGRQLRAVVTATKWAYRDGVVTTALSDPIRPAPVIPPPAPEPVPETPPITTAPPIGPGTGTGTDPRPTPGTPTTDKRHGRSLKRFHIAPRPRIHGVARVGERLRMPVARWRPKKAHFTFRWFADGTRVRGVTSRRLLLTPRLAGAQITVRIVAEKRGYETLRVRSRATSPVRYAARTLG